MILRKLRLQRSWSQEQLAQMSGLNVRTIQRIERGQSAGLESLKSLAAVFEIPVTELQEETEMSTDKTLIDEETRVIEHVRDIKGFYSHLTTYLLVNSGLLVLNLLVSPGVIWVLGSVLFWGIGVIAHGLSVFEVFNLFGPNWEKRQIEKRLGRKL